MSQDAEQVLVVPRALFETLGSFQGLNQDVNHYLATLLDPSNNFFMDRADAEEDPSYKQLIPYALFHHAGSFLHYYRGKSGGESRLHARGSIGVGGHINPVDRRADPLGRDTYLAAVERELTEELMMSGTHTNEPIAILNDDSSEVGKVHLGIVHLIELTDRKVESNEDALSDLSFKSVEELKTTAYQALEGWSQCCVDSLL